MATKQKKATAYEIVMNSRKEIVDEFIQMLEKGDLIWQQEWFGSRPFNPVTKSIYKGGNFIRLSIAAAKEGYTDPRWMTMKCIMDNGWQLKKGTHGVLCEKWKWIEDKMKDANGNYIKDANGNYVTDPDNKRFFVNFFKVFNASCVEGIEPLSRNSSVDSVEAEYMLENSPITVVYDSAVPEYRLSDDTIHLPKIFTCENAKYFNFYRELIKGTAHPFRMNRKYPPSMEALISELGAVFLSADTSLKVWKENSAAHVSEWVDLLKQDYNNFFKAAKEAEYATGWLEDVVGLEEAI